MLFGADAITVRGTMPTYHEIMTTDLSTLTTAADRWDGMAGEFGKRENQYRRDVHGISMGPSWQGLSADAANARFGITLKEFQAAQTEAKAVAALLRDAHTQFVDLCNKVKAVRQEAIDAGIKVSDRGVVSYDHDKAPGAPHHADAGKTQDAHKATASWQERINQAVRAVGDADQGVEIALTAAVIDSDINDGTFNGFNSHATGDIEKYEAAAANDIAMKLNRGESLSGREIAELQRSFRDNGNDKVFSRMFLDGLGADGTIRMTNRLNDLIHVQGGRSSRDFISIESGLAHTLATATKDTKSRWYADWRTDMQKAGEERYATDFSGIHLDTVRGYQSLVTLMEKGGGYAPQFLEDLGDDIIKVEKRDPDVWDLKGAYNGKRGGWFANDPLDGLLGVMSRDPDTAAHYLNSDQRMKYLMEDRDWKVILQEHEGAKASTYSSVLDGDDRVGFGAALQAATTGIDPSDPHAKFVEHSKANDAVFKSSLKYLADSGDDFPPSLREPVAKILVNHGGTVHSTASSVDMSASPLPQDQLFEVMKQVSKDETAYGTLNREINHALVSDIHASGQKYPEESLLRAGRTVGFLEEAHSQAAGDPETATFEGKALVDEAIGYLPVGSEKVQQGVDYVSDQWLADEQRRIDGKASAERVTNYEDRNHQLKALSDEWWKVHGSGGSTPYSRQESIDRAADAGISRAKGVSGEASG